MTLPVERFRAVNRAREFLRNLLNPTKTPRVPKEIRDQAYSVLKHFPDGFHIEQVAKQSPDVFMNEHQDKAYWEKQGKQKGNK